MDYYITVHVDYNNIIVREDYNIIVHTDYNIIVHMDYNILVVYVDYTDYLIHVDLSKVASLVKGSCLNVSGASWRRMPTYWVCGGGGLHRELEGRLFCRSHIVSGSIYWPSTAIRCIRSTH